MIKLITEIVDAILQFYIMVDNWRTSITIKRSTFKRKKKKKKEKRRKLILHSYGIKEKASRIYLFTHFFALCVTKLREVIYRGRGTVSHPLSVIFLLNKSFVSYFFIKKVIIDMTLTVTIFLKNIILIKKYGWGTVNCPPQIIFPKLDKRNDYRNCK
jgi:hypothetical protein